MRAFVRLREALAPQKELAAKLANLERKIAGHDESIRTLFEAIRELMAPADRLPRRGGGADLSDAEAPVNMGLSPAPPSASRGRETSQGDFG